MAHRALVAYERADDRYDVHTTRWGGLDCGLARLLTPDDPFGGGIVDAEPRVRNRPFESVLTMVDLASHEALYRVDQSFAVQTYLPLWFGLDHYLGSSPDGPIVADAPPGVLVAVDSTEEARALSRWLRAAKGILADAIDGGYLDLDAARTVLSEAARRRAGGREVLDPSQSRPE